MYTGGIFLLIQQFLAMMYTFEEHIGKEDDVLFLMCSGLQFTSICPFRLALFTKVEKLIIRYTSLTEIPDGIENLYNLVEFQYYHNKNAGTNEKMQKIANFKKLVYLNLDNNNLEEFPTCLSSLKRLKILNLNSNNITRIPNDLIFPKQLEIVHMKTNKLRDIPYGIFQLDKLYELDISHNLIVYIPDAIQNLSNLTVLNISNNFITKLPDAIGTLKNLEVLNISYNVIRQLPICIFYLVTLKELFAAHISLNRLSHLVVKLVNLQKLTISNNNLFFIPTDIRNILSLTYLDISYNKLTLFPEEFRLPKSLCTFILSDNNLNNLPDLTDLVFLSWVNVSGNKLKTLPSEIECLKDLKYLDASSNLLEELPDRFCNLPTITSLDLSRNRIAKLPYNFSNLVTLETLKLGNNLFKHIPQEVLKLQNLSKLYLMNNQISSLFETNYCINEMTNHLNLNEPIAHNSRTAVEPALVRDNSYFLPSLRIANFDYNKITSINNDILRFKNVKSLSFVNNNIRKVSEAIEELQNLEFLNLQGNEIQYLPFSLKGLRQNNLVVLYLQENFISNDNNEFGIGLKGIKKLQFNTLNVHTQYSTYITIDEVMYNIQKDDLHWNINKLKNIKLATDINELSTKISDKQMRKMWRVVLKYFIISEKKQDEPDSASSDEINYEIDNKISNIVNSTAFYVIKNNSKLGTRYIPEPIDAELTLSLGKRVSVFLREKETRTAGGNISAEITEYLIKTYIKALFYKLLEKIEEDITDINSLELVKLAITDLSENKMFACINGLLEGLQYYYSIFYSDGKAFTNNLLVDYIKNSIASIKETAFINVTNGDDINGTHDITKWRALFKDFLGISHSLDDPYASSFLKINSEYKKGSVLYDFFKQFTIDNVCRTILNKINSNIDKIKESIDLLKHIYKAENSIYDDYTIYMQVIQNYSDYEQVPGFAELRAKTLNKEGLIKILLHLQILKKKERHTGFKKLKSFIIPFVITWDGVVTTYHERYRKLLKVTIRIEAYIQSEILHKTLENVSLDYRKSSEDITVAEDMTEKVYVAAPIEEPQNPIDAS